MPFTTVQYIKMFQAALATAVTTQYTVPAARQDVIKDIEVANTTTNPLSLQMNVVPSGGSAANSNSIFQGIIIPGSQTFHWTGTIVMNAGDFIATATGGLGLTATVSGLESQ
jgi:hypothetical protein